MEKMVLDTQFWKNKKILITGHTGFKGGWLTLWLKKLNCDILGFSDSIPTSGIFKTLNLNDEICSKFGDIREYSAIHECIKNFKPEIIFHLAAQSLVFESYLDPIKTYNTNVMGTLNLFEAIRKTQTPSIVINVTSDKCYENKHLQRPFRESDPMGGYDPYSSSKGCAELLTSSYRNSFFNMNNFHEHNTLIASVRAGNVIGGGDWSKNRLIPDLIRGIENNNVVKIRNPNFIRPWQFILEPLLGYMLLVEKISKNSPDYADSWNFGPSSEKMETVSKIISFFQESFSQLQVSFEQNLKYESPSLILDSSKALKKLGWENKLDLQKSISLTCDWYKKFFDNHNMKNVSIEQIDKFSSLFIG